MRKVRYSILCDGNRGIYIPQYSKDGICWYSFENPTYGYSLCFKTLDEAKKYIKSLEELQEKE